MRKSCTLYACACLLTIAASQSVLLAQRHTLVRSAQSGAWSAAATWEGGKVPTAGAQVLVRSSHTIAYDLQSHEVIRSLHISGVLTFVPDKDTRLDVGLIRIQHSEAI